MSGSPSPSGGAQVAAQHAALAARVRAYLAERLPVLPQHDLLAPHLAPAMVLVVGGHALDQGGDVVPVEVECVLDAQGTRTLQPGRGRADLDVLDPGVLPPVQLRVRDEEWLDRRLAQPDGLWLHQRATVVRDPQGALPDAMGDAMGGFRRRLPALVAERYGWLRTGLDRSAGCRDGLARRLLIARLVEAALELPLLARGEPFPPPEWLAWHVGRVCPQGEEILGLCGRLAAAPAVDRPTAAHLRRLEDDLLEAAGHGESLVRNYWNRV